LEQANLEQANKVHFLNDRIRNRGREMMGEKEREKREELLTGIQKQLQKNSLEELEHIQHTLSAMVESKKSGLYYFARFLGIEWDNGSPTMTLGMQHANTYGVAQGGTIYTLADMSMGYKVLSQLPPEKNVHTLEMKMNFVSPGRGEKLFADPEILHLGRTTAVVTCRVQDNKSKLVAQGLGTFFITDRKD
jgi:uncharacterized protein (TIGR00369 family)